MQTRHRLNDTAKPSQVTEDYWIFVDREKGNYPVHSKVNGGEVASFYSHIGN